MSSVEGLLGCLSGLTPMCSGGLTAKPSCTRNNMLQRAQEGNIPKEIMRQIGS